MIHGKQSSKKAIKQVFSSQRNHFRGDTRERHILLQVRTERPVAIKGALTPAIAPMHPLHEVHMCGLEGSSLGLTYTMSKGPSA
jgi:hypothetical protein